MARELNKARKSGRVFAPAKRKAPILRALLTSCIAFVLAAYVSYAPSAPRLATHAPYAPSTPSHQNEGIWEADGDTSHQRTHAVGNETLTVPRVQPLIEAAGSNIFLLDLTLRSGARTSSSGGAQDGTGGMQPPWFEGFVTSGSEATAVAAVTVGHPIRRMLSYFREEAVDLEASLTWMEDEGFTAHSSTNYRRDYQLVDNYLVRVLAGKSAWELPPGGVGAAELMAARIVLGKFEVLLREECLSTDISLLMPYLDTADAAAETSSWEGNDFPEPQELSLPPGEAGRRLVRANRWDLQLWDFANRLVMSRSATVESYLCGATRRERTQITLGAGRRAVVYNSPDYHLTVVSMFSCVLMSWGFRVTAVLKKPTEDFLQLLPCAHDVVSLRDPITHIDQTAHTSETVVWNSTVAEKLGLSPRTQSGNGVGFGGGGAEGHGAARESGGRGLFDVSVLCTAYQDLNMLLNPNHHEMGDKLVGPLLWNVNVSIWNMHGVSRVFDNGSVPSAAHDFAERIPSSQGKKPPPTFVVVHGEQVERWEAVLEEAYEGWGPKPSRHDEGLRRKKETNLRGLFPHTGVVHHILPTGGMRIPRPNTGLFVSKHDGGASVDGRMALAETRRIRFVVQGKLVSARRDYKTLLACLEAMCADGRDNFSLDVVGSSGHLTEEIQAHPCVASLYTEGLHLEYNDFYARISQGDFVVTAAAGDDYEYDRATSSVPTALLLEKPLVMASSLMNAYPCLWNSRIHSMVANDDLCLNLQAAYDLTPQEYDEMELEARDCKLAVWKQTRETVAEIVLKGRDSSHS